MSNSNGNDFSARSSRVVAGMLAEAGITQSSVAAKLDRGNTYVSDRCMGKASWTLGDLDVIAGMLGLTPDEMLTLLQQRLLGPQFHVEP